MKRYEALADDIARSIRSGLLKPGERLPSVRQASAARKLSPATIFQAYYRLEAQGLIESRARSGYYVSRAVAALPPEPETASRPTANRAQWMSANSSSTSCNPRCTAMSFRSAQPS